MFQIPEGASRFMMYGGGDGIGFSPFGEKRTEANSAFSSRNYFVKFLKIFLLIIYWPNFEIIWNNGLVSSKIVQNILII